MDDMSSRAKTEISSQAKNIINSQVDNNKNSQVNIESDSGVSKPVAVPGKPGRPRLYADKAEAMKAYRTRVRKLQAESADALDKLSTAVLSDLLAKSLRTWASNVETPEMPVATEARKQAGRIIKVLRARYTIRLG
jgi:hypothetical protein